MGGQVKGQAQKAIRKDGYLWVFFSPGLAILSPPIYDPAKIRDCILTGLFSFHEMMTLAKEMETSERALFSVYIFPSKYNSGCSSQIALDHLLSSDKSMTLHKWAVQNA